MGKKKKDYTLKRLFKTPKTAFSLLLETVPTLRMMLFLSAVKIRLGLINEFEGKEPLVKSSKLRVIAKMSFVFCDVI